MSAQDPCSSRPPFPNQLTDPLVLTLGKATGFKTGVFVPLGPVIEDTVRAAGYDPENLSQYGDPEEGWRMGKVSTVGFKRRVWYAFQNAHRLRKVSLTASGPKSGVWGLTEAGVAYARLLGGQNRTAAYLDQRLKETGGMEGSLMGLLRAALTKKLPRSAAASIVDDHIHNCMVRLISRDSLRERLLQGKRIPDTMLASYVVRSGYTDIRKMGTNPVCRELYGARTECERRKGAHFGVHTNVHDDRITWTSGDDGFSQMLDISDTSSLVQDVVDRDDFEHLWDEVEKAVRLRKPKRVAARYIGILKMRRDGWTVKEIAEAEQVSTHRAASIMAEARRCLRDAAECGELGLAL